MRYIASIALIICIVWLVAIFPWLLLVAGIVWLVTIMGDL